MLGQTTHSILPSPIWLLYRRNAPDPSFGSFLRSTSSNRGCCGVGLELPNYSAASLIRPTTYYPSLSQVFLEIFLAAEPSSALRKGYISFGYQADSAENSPEVSHDVAKSNQLGRIPVWNGEGLAQRFCKLRWREKYQIHRSSWITIRRICFSRRPRRRRGTFRKHSWRGSPKTAVSYRVFLHAETF